VSRGREVRPYALLLLLCTATFMSSLDLFIVNVGLRAIGADVGQGSLANLSWVLNAYAIVFAALLVPAGRLADRYGNKQLFLAGLILFTVGSLGCAASSDLWFIVGLRCLQATGAAALVPTSLGLILTAMPAARRTYSVQLWAVSGSIGAAAGPVLGGLLVQLSWRWIFLLNVPIGVGALVAAAFLAPNVRHGTETRIPDLLGGLLLMIGIGSLALALVQGPQWGWLSGRALGTFGVAAIGLAAFGARTRTAAVPVVDFGLFRDQAFAWGSVANLLLGTCFGAQLLGLVLWLQEGWGWSALPTGLGIAPGPVMVSVTAVGLRSYTRDLPAGRVAATGALLMGAGGLLIGRTLTAQTHYAAQVLPGWLIIGAGFGFAVPTLVGAATRGLAPSQTSTGSAIVQMARQIGSVLGVVLLVVVVGGGTANAGRLGRFVDVWWWAAGLAALAVIASIRIDRHGRRARTLPSVPTVNRAHTDPEPVAVP
jgi:EmrB/QacA subfamily drug resistance transporter